MPSTYDREYNARSSLDNFISANKFSFGYYGFARLTFSLSYPFSFRMQAKRESRGQGRTIENEYSSYPADVAYGILRIDVIMLRVINLIYWLAKTRRSMSLIPL